MHSSKDECYFRCECHKKRKTLANVNIIILQTNSTTHMLIKKYLYINVLKYVPIFQSVATEPMDTVVLTTAVVTVWGTLHVTNRVDTVTGDVNPNIPMPYVAKVS